LRQRIALLAGFAIRRSIFVLLALSSCVGAPQARPVGSRPNVLWITAEDMSPWLGCWGDGYARTPHLDRLAAESVRYTHAFSTAPVCSPARSTLITGMYATTLGTQRLRSQFPIPDHVRGFPAYLREAGYYCTNNVKTDYNTSAEPRLIRESWDESSEKAHWRGRRPGQPFFAVFNDMTTHQSRNMVWPYEQFQKEVQSRLEPGEIHDPAMAPVPPYYPDTPIVRRTIARAYDCITVMDKHVGRILRELEEDGLAADTIVFFFSDHGVGLPRGKRTLYDSGLRVPLLVRFPPQWRHLAPADPGSTLDRLVSFIDFPPTVLALAGLPPPGHMQGRDFLRGPEPTHVYGTRDRVDEAYDLSRSVRDGRWLYIRNYMPHLPLGQPSAYCDQSEIRQEMWRLAAEGKLSGAAKEFMTGRRPLEELYDTVEDPHQLRNLSAEPSHETLLGRMRGLQEHWNRESRDLGFVPEPEAGKGIEWDVEDLEVLAWRTPEMRRHFLLHLDWFMATMNLSTQYWTAVGLQALPEAVPELCGRLKDHRSGWPVVRVALAAARARHGDVDGALQVLLPELSAANPSVALEACRAIELLGEKARAARPAMQALFDRVKDAPGDPAMFLRFSSGAFLEKVIR
jgi:arylsulfatase A-like enzyme